MQAAKIKLVVLCCSVIAMAARCNAQQRNTGKITSYKKVFGGIEGKTATSIFDIHAYSDHIIRVRISKNKTLNSFSYALVDNQIPLFENYSIKEEGNSITLSTNAINVEIEKAPAFSITFKNKAGQIINEDVKGTCFGTTFSGDKATVYKKLQEGERFVGLGEALGNLDKRGMGITLNNTDNYKYGDTRLPMYISVPFYIGIHHQDVYGLFYNNSYKSFFNFASSTPNFSSVSFEGGDMDYFFMYDESLAKVIEHYSSLTGKMQLPPKWSIGYHQSRCSYYPQEKVTWIAETFRRKKIPLDCIVLDADYQQGYQPFRVNKERFPDMPGLAASLAKMNIELTASVYPGVKIDSSYELYTDGLKKNVFIKYADGSLFKTEIAPLPVLLPDYTNPNTRAWWIDKMKWLPDNGIHGYWNDMNEPAVAGSYLPDNLVFNFDGHATNAQEAKNVYGFQMARSSYESAVKYGNGRRPFVLTRSAFAGVQRYSAVWSGDNTASDEGLLSGVLLNSQMGLSGIPFAGPDLGGYIGDGTKDLFKRWIEVGVFSPFVRNHKGFFTPDNEPWSYGEEIEGIAKTFIEFRYRMMPYVYSAFYEASQTGMPIARSLCINYPFDDKVYDNVYQYQFLFGAAMLVVPVTSLENNKKIYLPKGVWYNIYSDEKITGEKSWTQDVPAYQIPVFIKASSVIPMQSVVQSAKEKPSDTLWLHVYNGKEKNSFVYYEDKGDGMEYQKGGYCKRVITFDPVQKQLLLQTQEGTYQSDFKQLQLVFHGFENAITGVSINKGNDRPLQEGWEKMLDGLQYMEDLYDPAYYQSVRNAEQVSTQKIITIENSAKAILVQWK
ncbi:MAG: glycoside hydrolase family 31 [Ferruginibacter sp.]|uniref:glycoside hydrolase family 31 protein n=1 Tax=Ferruginibacter sp. TaxID=1940288 RepID=UPI002658277F|nr:glycoside hydrolase family 31 protein [Ferruginibacter sp.]MDB5275264.1 glycoside hydrolase family 31 [Ferruginibacter sp.]